MLKAVENVNTEIGYVRCIGKGQKERIIPVGKQACHAVKKYLENLSNHSAEIYVVLLEDLYESLHGDSKFHYMDSVFIQKVDAL